MSSLASSRPPLARVALETTLLLHGVPTSESLALFRRLSKVVEAHGGVPSLVGVVDGRARADLTEADLAHLLEVFAREPSRVPKTNLSNLSAVLFRKGHAATTVSTTMQIASGAGISVFATGGLGGVHPPIAVAQGSAASSFDISADLQALTRFPVCVVASGVKSILDVPATREVLETLGVPVIGYQTSDFPAFYLRRHPESHVNACDARFDDARELADFVRFELARTNRGVLVCNPIPAEHEIAPDRWRTWLAEARASIAAGEGSGRDATPALLGALHRVSGGATLRANIELVASNAALAGQIAAGMVRGR